ncbi:MAG: hypothetical protein AB7F22_07865 [Reyranella sp.]|uniref:hypothetical protein n=1 Tax=Reyranella sp. TaxID=1929291 RepID=UPI003D111594
MAVGHTKSTPITNLDATPAVRIQAGKGGAGRLKHISANVTAPAAANGDIDTTIQFVRIPWTSIVKRIHFSGASQGSAGKVDIGVYHATDGSNASAISSLLAANAVDQDFFVAALDLGGAASQITVNPGAGFGYDGVATGVVATAPAWARSDANLPLWEAIGLSAAPGGNADIVATVTEALQTGAAAMYLAVEYIE